VPQILVVARLNRDTAPPLLPAMLQGTAGAQLTSEIAVTANKRLCSNRIFVIMALHTPFFGTLPP